MRTLALTLILTIAPLAQTQTDHPNGGALEEQRHAMQKLNYLVGRWTGEATLTPPTGTPIKLNETETAQYKSNGTVLEISSIGFAPDGTTPRNFLTTITYDNASFTYRIATKANGRPITADLAIQPTGYAWAYIEGPARTTTTMLLTEKGDWSESTMTTTGDTPARTSFQMLLHLRP